MLVADSHFEPTVPAALYLAHLRCPELDVAGATLPGVPIFWWGRNPWLAWASVNAGKNCAEAIKIEHVIDAIIVPPAFCRRRAGDGLRCEAEHSLIGVSPHG